MYHERKKRNEKENNGKKTAYQEAKNFAKVSTEKN